MLKISNPEKYSVALYIRLSREDDYAGESHSVTNQISLLKSFAEDKKLLVYDTYIDDGWSGTNYDRPGFNKLLNDINLKRVNMVITKDLSRLGRDYIETGAYLEKHFPEMNVRYISINDEIDTGIDSTINDITPFKAIMNDMYAKDISKKVKTIKQHRAKLGLYMGTYAPFRV